MTKQVNGSDQNEADTDSTAESLFDRLALSFRSWKQALIHNEGDGAGPVDARERAGYMLVMYSFPLSVFTGFIYASVTLPVSLLKIVLSSIYAVSVFVNACGVIIVTVSIFSRR
jgi:hypothetical protein